MRKKTKKTGKRAAKIARRKAQEKVKDNRAAELRELLLSTRYLTRDGHSLAKAFSDEYAKWFGYNTVLESHQYDNLDLRREHICSVAGCLSVLGARGLERKLGLSKGALATNRFYSVGINYEKGGTAPHLNFSSEHVDLSEAKGHAVRVYGVRSWIGEIPPTKYKPAKSVDRTPPGLEEVMPLMASLVRGHD